MEDICPLIHKLKCIKLKYSSSQEYKKSNLILPSLQMLYNAQCCSTKILAAVQIIDYTRKMSTVHQHLVIKLLFTEITFAILSVVLTFVPDKKESVLPAVFCSSALVVSLLLELPFILLKQKYVPIFILNCLKALAGLLLLVSCPTEFQDLQQNPGILAFFLVVFSQIIKAAYFMYLHLSIKSPTSPHK